MKLDTVPIPEPFKTALDGEELNRVCDLEATSPEARFARGLAARSDGDVPTSDAEGARTERAVVAGRGAVVGGG